MFRFDHKNKSEIDANCSNQAVRVLRTLIASSSVDPKSVGQTTITLGLGTPEYIGILSLSPHAELTSLCASIKILAISCSIKCFYINVCTVCLVLQHVRCPTHRWLPYTAAWFGYRSAGLGLNGLWSGSHWEALVLLGPLGLQSQLIGYLERLAERQDNLIGQVLYGKGERGRPGPTF